MTVVTLNADAGSAEPPSGDEIASHRAQPKRRVSETADEYPAVVAVLDAKTRVIECAAGIQWIVQVRRREGRWPWESVSFCRTKEALLRCASPHGQHPALLALPDRFPEAAE